MDGGNPQGRFQRQEQKVAVGENPQGGNCLSLLTSPGQRDKPGGKQLSSHRCISERANLSSVPPKPDSDDKEPQLTGTCFAFVAEGLIQRVPTCFKVTGNVLTITKTFLGMRRN